MSEKRESKGKFREVLRLFKNFFVSLHHLVWGKGKKRLLVALVVTVVVLTLFMALTMEVTSRPGFCKTCHYMEPYYQSWKESSHHDVTCTDCHFPPGIRNKIKGKMTALSMLVNYFTGVYKKSKPWAEISDSSCMREGCHETRMLAGSVPFKKNIKFNHEPHLTQLRRGKKLRCTSCHSQIVQGSHLSVTETTCFLCHFKDMDSQTSINQCTRCHEAPVADKDENTKIAFDHTEVVARNVACPKCHGRMILGDGAVPRNRCNSCHAQLDTIKRYNDTDFLHKNHITDHKIECDQCHTEIQHKSISRTELVKPDCRACHPDFHQAQLALFSGTGGRGTPDHPSPMFNSGLNCQACHIFHNLDSNFKAKGESFIANAKACDPCHGAGYHKILETWNQQTQRKLGQLDRVIKAARNRAQAGKNNSRFPEASQKLEDALYNYNLVKYGKSIHNIAFANQLMERSFKFAVESLKILGLSTTLPYFEQLDNLIPGECSNCHAGVERIEKKAFGWIFPHYEHLVKRELTCNRCHSNEQVHGQLIIKREDCMSCHHQDRQSGCKDCHEIQDSVYNSRLAFSTFKIPNVMAEDVSCLDCHEDDRENLVRPGKKICSNCHEKDYETFFDQWQESALDMMESLRRKITRDKLKKGDFTYETLLLLQKDGSKGVHNPDLYEKLIDEALKRKD